MVPVMEKIKRGMAYIPGDSLVHELDPRTKLFILIAVSAGAILSGNSFSVIIMFAFVVGLVLLSGLLRKWIRSLGILVPLIVITILVDSLFTSSANPYGGTIFSADIWFLHLEMTFGSLKYAATMSLRIITIAGFSFLFVMTTRYNQFVKSLSLAGLPKTFAFSLGYALKSVTSLSSDAGEIIDAQTSRGLVIDKDLVLKRPARLLSIFVPMTVSVMERAHQVSDAMQCRGYGLHQKTTIYGAPSMKKTDYLMIGISTAVLVLNISTVSIIGESIL